MKQRPSFDPWPGENHVWHGQRKQSRNWMPWVVIGILGVGVGISALLLWTA